MSKRLVVAAVFVSAILLTGCNASAPTASVNGAATTAETVTWCITEPQKTENCYPPMEIHSGENAYDSFVALDQRESSLTFTSTNYGASGYFVDSINGTAGTANAFWSLYYNGQQSQVGISSINLNNGDKLAFKYEAVQP